MTQISKTRPADPKRIADRVLDALGIIEPQDLQLLDLVAFQRGAVVRQGQLDGAEARITILGQKAIITVSPNIRDPRRQRFSIAHELGHFEMHRWMSNLISCTSGDISDGLAGLSEKENEWQANEFAGALLLPERFVASRFLDSDPSLALVVSLANEFNTSVTATAIRYMQFCEAPCAIVLSKDGKVNWFRASQAFLELGLFVETRARLDPLSSAASFFKGKDLPKRPIRVDADVWLQEGRYPASLSIVEDSVGIPTHNAVLSLLWIDADYDEDDFY